MLYPSELHARLSNFSFKIFYRSHPVSRQEFCIEMLSGVGRSVPQHRLSRHNIEIFQMSGQPTAKREESLPFEPRSSMTTFMCFCPRFRMSIGLESSLRPIPFLAGKTHPSFLRLRPVPPSQSTRLIFSSFSAEPGRVRSSAI